MKRSIILCLLATSAVMAACMEHTQNVGCESEVTECVEDELTCYTCVDGKYWKKEVCQYGFNENYNECNSALSDCRFGRLENGKCKCNNHCASDCNEDGTCKCLMGWKDDGSCKEALNCKNDYDKNNQHNSDGSCKCHKNCQDDCNPDGSCICSNECAYGCNADGSCKHPDCVKSDMLNEKTGVCECDTNYCKYGCNEKGACIDIDGCKYGTNADGSCACNDSCKQDCNLDGSCICTGCLNGCKDDGSCVCSESCGSTGCLKNGVCKSYGMCDTWGVC